MPYVAINGGQLYYEVDGQGPPVVFAHGLGGNHMSWWQQVPALKQRFTCITFAHPGFRPSENAGGAPPDISTFAEHLATLVRHLDRGPVGLVAQSMGGWTCLRFALEHPEQVWGLVMCDTVGGLVHPEVDRLVQQHDHGAGAALFARGIHPAAGDRLFREQPALHHLYLEIDRLNAHVDKQALRAALYRQRDAPAERVAQLRLPMLCLSGAEDVVVPPLAPKVLASLVPGARFESVPEAGHSVYFERPEAFNRLVGDFLGGCQ